MFQRSTVLSEGCHLIHTYPFFETSYLHGWAHAALPRMMLEMELSGRV